MNNDTFIDTLRHDTFDSLALLARSDADDRGDIYFKIGQLEFFALYVKWFMAVHLPKQPQVKIAELARTLEVVRPEEGSDHYARWRSGVASGAAALADESAAPSHGREVRRSHLV